MGSGRRRKARLARGLLVLGRHRVRAGLFGWRLVGDRSLLDGLRLLLGCDRLGLARRGQVLGHRLGLDLVGRLGLSLAGVRRGVALGEHLVGETQVADLAEIALTLVRGVSAVDRPERKLLALDALDTQREPAAL